MHDSNIWSIVLAGGEGTRVRSFLQQLCGGQGLKQFSAIVGRRSMIQVTLDRIQQLTPPERVLIVVATQHREEVAQQLARWPQEKIIYQPTNRDTGPGIFLPLAHVSHRDPLATVAVFPSDHFVLDEEEFMASVRMALKDLDQEPEKIVLLGMTPTEGQETEYGYIEVGKKDQTLCSLPVKGFLEKPSRDLAKRLIGRGALWNTMVFAARANTMWRAARECTPALYDKFTLVRRMLDSENASCFIEQIYETMPAVYFSAQICQAAAPRLRVLPVPEVGWSDWGNTTSIIRSLKKIGAYDEFKNRLKQRGVDPSLYLPARALGGTDVPRRYRPSRPLSPSASVAK